MKNFILTFSALILISLYSCNKEDDIITSELSKEDITSEDIQKLQDETNLEFMDQIISQSNGGYYFFSDNETDDKEIVLGMLPNEPLKASTMAVAETVIHGPYSTTMPASRILQQYKVAITGISGLSSGIYFCDVYKYTKKITLPSNAIAGYINEVSPVGFKNYTTQESGYVSISDGSTTLEVTTYKLHVLYNILGQQINKVYPTNLNGVSYTTAKYSYITL